MTAGAPPAAPAAPASPRGRRSRGGSSGAGEAAGWAVTGAAIGAATADKRSEAGPSGWRTCQGPAGRQVARTVRGAGGAVPLYFSRTSS